MPTPNTVQEAKKQMQLARLEQKGKKGYAKFYAAQPQQVERARRNAEWRAARDAAKQAQTNFDIAEITGKGLEAAREALQIAILVAERTQPGRRGGNASVSLSGV